MRVFATRPLAQNSSWTESLREAGFDVVECPLLEIVSVERAEQRPIVNIVLDLDQYNKAIFVSQNAVEHAFTYIQQYWPQLPFGLSWFGVGVKTRALLSSYLEEGFCFTGLATEQNVMNSEDLLALEELQIVEGEKVLIFRGVGGRDLIRLTLEARGAEVQYCELYKRTAPDTAAATLEQARLTDADCIPVFSGESLENLDRILSSGSAGHAEPILVLPGERVEAIAKELDYEKYIVAKNASEQAMLAAIKDALKTGKQT